MKTKLCALAVAIATIWGLKRYYAGARADDLWWILTPTAKLAGVMAGTPFLAESGEGYLSRERLFLIEKSCAGVNFMIAAFGMLAFALRRRIDSCVSGGSVLATSLVASYSAAVLVNAVRIAVAIWLSAHAGALPALDAAQVHRVEGITVYFGGLVAVHEIAQRLDRRAAVVRNRS
jgi:exosortase K